MSNMTSESEDKLVANSYIDSPSIEEVSSEGNVAGSGLLKKGPWTSAEDAILVDYVNKYGEGNWNAVQKHSGLSRCGKSCRLRWANHLRPDLKKGAFTPDEERRIIELHANMGNKWARMAAELPGRTDNEIKNFWNTRIKRRQQAGLPIYPPDIRLQPSNENHPSHDIGTFSTGDTPLPELFPTNNLEIPSVDFKNLELNQRFYPSFVDIPGSSLLSQGLGSTCNNSFPFSTMHPVKRVRESEPTLPGFSGIVSDVLPAFDQYRDDGSRKIAKSFGGSSYDHNLSSTSCLLPGSHALLNGNSSSSEPISWAMKLELPSLQYSDTQMGSWGTPSPLPSLESVDTLIQMPPTEQTQSDCLSPQNNGLLESVLYESQTLKNSKNNLCQQTSYASAAPGDVVYSSSLLHYADWVVYAEPHSPLGLSFASVFSEYTPTSGSSLDEPVGQDIIRPDFLLDSNWFGPSTEHGKDHSILTDSIGALLCEDFSSDCRQLGVVACSGQDCSHGSREWDSMSTAICDISGHHSLKS